MQFRWLVGLIVFLGSYLPLSVILLAQDFDFSALQRDACWSIAEVTCDLPLQNPWFSAGTFITCLICFFVTLGSLRTVRAKLPIRISSAQHIPAELMSYTLPYVVSFMSMNYRETGQFVGLLIFLAWMFWITSKAGQLILNPVLIVFGWKHYQLSYMFPGDKTVRTGVALADGPIHPDERHVHTTIQDILIIRVPQEREENV